MLVARPAAAGAGDECTGHDRTGLPPTGHRMVPGRPGGHRRAVIRAGWPQGLPGVTESCVRMPAPRRAAAPPSRCACPRSAQAGRGPGRRTSRRRAAADGRPARGRAASRTPRFPIRAMPARSWRVRSTATSPAPSRVATRTRDRSRCAASMSSGHRSYARCWSSQCPVEVSSSRAWARRRSAPRRCRPAASPRRAARARVGLRRQRADHHCGAAPPPPPGVEEGGIRGGLPVEPEVDDGAPCSANGCPCPGALLGRLRQALSGRLVVGQQPVARCRGTQRRSRAHSASAMRRSAAKAGHASWARSTPGCAGSASTPYGSRLGSADLDLVDGVEQLAYPRRVVRPGGPDGP